MGKGDTGCKNKPITELSGVKDVEYKFCFNCFEMFQKF